EVYRAAAHALEEVEKSEVLNHEALRNDLNRNGTELADKHSFTELEREKRWDVRQAIYRVERALNRFPPEARQHLSKELKTLRGAIEFVPFWVVVGVALALGVGTTIGYKRIVVTVAEKIGKTHLSYGQGMMAEVVAASTIMLA